LTTTGRTGSNGWFATYIEDFNGEVAQHTPVNNAADVAHRILLFDRNKEEWLARAHAYCPCNINVVWVQTVELPGILWQAYYTPGTDIRGDDGEAIAEARVIFLTFDDEVAEGVLYIDGR